jgi:hypothetical protein
MIRDDKEMEMIIGRHISIKLVISAVLVLMLDGCAQTPLEERPAASAPPPVVTPEAAVVKRPAEPIRLKPDHPQTYLVGPEDTVYDIAARFLVAPWQWPEVWRPGPGVKDPSLIYPGEVIELYYEKGQPRLRPARGRPEVKLSPQLRAEPLTEPITAIPRSAIESFLKRTVILSPAEWDALPRIVANDDDRVVMGENDRIYARGDVDFDQNYYRVFRVAQEYRDPATRQSLGFGGIYVGDAVLQQEGDPSTFVLTASRRDARVGDRLLAAEDEIETYRFLPHPPPPDTEGVIIAVPGDSLLIGQYQSVVLDLGEDDGVEPGHVLAIYSGSRPVTDPVSGSIVRLPDEKTGLLMLYKVYDKVSYGLVMSADRNIAVLDRVKNP